MMSHREKREGDHKAHSEVAEELIPYTENNELQIP